MVSRKQAWAMWFVASIFYAYQYILRVMPNIVINDVMDKFDIDIATFGQLSGVYYIGYSLCHLPIGLMLDRFGPKNILPLFMLLSVIGMLPFVYSELWIYPIIGRAVIGIGSSAAILGLFKVIRIGFAEAKFTRMLSFAVTIGLSGAIYGGAPVEELRNQFGFEYIINFLIIIGIILSVITYLIIPKNQITEIKTSIWQEMREVFSNRKVLLVCIFAGLMVGPLEGFADVWGKSFLMHVYHIEGAMAARLTSLMFVGMCFGAPVLSLIAEKSNSYFTIIMSGIFMAIGFGLIMTGMLPIWGLSAIFVIMGVLCSYQIIAIYKASSYVREEVIGLTTATANMIIMIFGYIFHSSIGQVISMTSSLGADTSFVYGIAVIPVALCLAVFGFSLLAGAEKKLA